MYALLSNRLLKNFSQFSFFLAGGTPYPSVSNRELLGLLKSGYRMGKPENCADPM